MFYLLLYLAGVGVELSLSRRLWDKAVVGPTRQLEYNTYSLSFVLVVYEDTRYKTIEDLNHN